MHTSIERFCAIFFLILVLAKTERVVPVTHVATFEIQNLTIKWSNHECSDAVEDCVYKLRICGGVSFRKAPMNRNCPYLYQTYDISSNTYPNSLTIPIRIRWPETPWHLTISILRNYHDILFESSAFYEKHTASNDWEIVNLKTSTTDIKFNFKIECQPFMFGPSCATYCNDKQPDPLGGHFKCSSLGDRLCAPNWTGLGCNEPICYQKCVEGQGNCTLPNVCSCNRGWKGASCDQCVPLRGCQHGYCNRPGECICHEHWTGPACNIEVDYCRRHAGICLNGGTCSSAGMENGYYCNCTTEFEGQNCEIPRDPCSSIDCGKGLCVNEDGHPRCYCPPGTFCTDLDKTGDLESNYMQTSAAEFIWSHTFSSILSLLCLVFGLISLLAGFYYLHRKKLAQSDSSIESIGSIESSFSKEKRTALCDDLMEPPPSYSLLDVSEKSPSPRISRESRKFIFSSTTV